MLNIKNIGERDGRLTYEVGPNSDGRHEVGHFPTGVSVLSEGESLATPVSIIVFGHITNGKVERPGVVGRIFI